VYGSVFECQFVGLDGVVVKRSLLVGARAPAVLWGEVAPAVRLLWGRVAPTAVPLAVAVALVPMVAMTVWLAATSAHVEHPTATALYWSYFVAAHVLIGLYWWLRRPASRFGPLLVALGIVAWVVSWESSQWPLAFDLGVLAEGPGAFLTFYLLLAFPTGRLDSVALRWLMLALAVAIAGFFLPWALFTPVIAGGGVLSRCVPACPENVLQIGSAPRLVEVAGKAETYSLLAITVAVLAVYAVRLRAASRPRRRALLAVAVTSLLFLPVFFAFHFSRLVLEVAPQTLDVLQWALVGARILFPLGFLVALVQADAFAATASRRLLERLVTRPTPARWHALVARTLDDPALRLGFWDPPSREFRGPDGIEVTPPAWDSGRAWVPVERDGHPVAAMDIDEALATDAELVRAAASATLLAVENGQLEGELRASAARIIEAGQAERRLLERDLHDSAQQRLVALRIHLSLTSERLDQPDQRAMLEQLGSEVEKTIDELRSVAHGVHPQLLEQHGIAAALRSARQHTGLPVAIDDQGLTRHAPTLELTIYFCCLEALQNVAKHAGPGASATIRLREDDRCVRFTIEDDGSGFDPAAVKHGAGLTNLADRVAAHGGTIEVDSSPGRGTRVIGHVPV
jgi:signal transduction histidine kinase